jgi:hypothetical protein
MPDIRIDIAGNASPVVSSTGGRLSLLPYQRRFLNRLSGTQSRLMCNRKVGKALYIEMVRTWQELLREIQSRAPHA